MANTKANSNFIHLRCHSAYSLLEGAMTITRLSDLATKNAMPALAITDRNNLFGALEFSQTMSSSGVQPIIGCTLCIEFGDASRSSGYGKGYADNGAPSEASSGYLALIAKDETGYENLLRLTSAAFLENGETSLPYVDIETLQSSSQGLIALTGGPEGPIDRCLASENPEIALQRAQKLHSVFADRLYVELQRHGLESEKRVEPELLKLAYDNDLPIVATNQPYFAETSHFEAHDALICIAEGSYISVDDRRRLSPEHYFKSGTEMEALFSDLPEAIENTIEIARRCAFRPHTRDPILPKSVNRADISAEEVLADEAKALRDLAESGLANRLETFGTAPDTNEENYRARLETELKIITDMKYPGYFLIVADFIQWAKQQNIPVGPGRGSGAGSVVAWALTITDLDPLRFGLLFERFLNPERVSMPDFDIDFCQDRRDEVIRYVQEKYGEDRVAQIITFGKLQARAVLRDVGRVLQMPYGHVDRLCKLVPADPANPVTLAEAIAGEPQLQEERKKEPIVARLLDIGQRLEGLYRHASTHAAGIVIGDRPLNELVPLYRDPRSSLPATQFNMKWVEAAGLVKFDFLGLKTLTVIEKAVELVARRGTNLDPATLPLDDTATFDLLGKAETVGVFQLESAGMRDALRKLKPDRFEDIIAMVALYRPGPMANIESFINRKHKLEEVDYLHPLIAPILQETYGVIIYQEQVMKIAQDLSGYSLGEADLLRRAMGKKIKKEMDEQRTRFVEGAVANKVDKGRAEYIFELVAKFAGYGFNKSHAAAYALLAYQTAYLKANYPVEFLAASMTLDMGNTDKLNIFVQDARSAGIEIEPPCVNVSRAEFDPDKISIRYALGALKNMGRAAAETLVNERLENGPYKSLADFASRVDARSINKRGLETMIAAGALDVFGTDRAKLFENTDRIIRAASSGSSDNQDDLFGAETAHELILRDTDSWSALDRLSREKDAIGFFVSGHPLDEYASFIQQEKLKTWAEFSSQASRGSSAGRIAAVVSHKQERTSAKGNRFAFIGMSDQSGQFEAIVFSELLASHGELLTAGSVVLAELEVENSAESLRARLVAVQALDDVADRDQTGIRIEMNQDAPIGKLKERIPEQGRGEIYIALKLDDIGQEVELALSDRYDISSRSRDALSTLNGVNAVEQLSANSRRKNLDAKTPVLALAKS